MLLDVPESTSPLDKAVSAALSHARNERVGLREWRSSRLHWEVSGQVWDANLACYVIVITAQPLDQPEAPPAQWEYQLDEEARILPGFPVIQNLPNWERVPGASAANPANQGPRFSLGMLAAVGILALVSLIWLLSSASPGLDASQPEPTATATPTPVPAPSPTPPPTVLPTLPPTTTPVPTATPMPTLLPTPSPNPTPTRLAPTEPPTPTVTPTAVPTPIPTAVIPTATPRPTLAPTRTPIPPTPTRAPTLVPTPSRAPTVTPVPSHLLFINGIQVPGQQSLVFYAGARLTLSQAPKPDGRYANNASVTIAVSPPPGSEVIWGGVDSQRGLFVTVQMNADRFVTIEIRTPSATP